MNEVIWSREIDEVFRIGRFLGEFGISNWAFTRSQALDIITKLQRLRIPVLGGDVCEMDLYGRILPNYDSWHCERRPDESREDFAERSLHKARTYIESYSINADEEKFFFTLVPAV
jgi:hypothetical protein